jgi:hypothetical protein
MRATKVWEYIVIPGNSAGRYQKETDGRFVRTTPRTLQESESESDSFATRGPVRLGPFSTNGRFSREKGGEMLVT